MLREDLKVGDRVVVEGYEIFDLEDGDKGTVRELGDYDCVVEFDKDVGGWYDKKLGIEMGHGIYITYDCLKLLE